MPKKQEQTPTATAFKFIKTNAVTVISAPFSGGQPKGGVDKGPNMMLEAGLVKQLEALNWVVDVELNDFETHSKEILKKRKVTKDKVEHIFKNLELVSRVCEELSLTVSKHSKKGGLVVTLGGDHSLGMSTVSGIASVHANLGVIWVDAHADINTLESTDSGNLHGCPVSFLLGLPGNKNIPEFSWLKPCITPQRLVYIGLRDVDKGEKELLKANNIKAFSMFHVDKYGIGKVMEMALEHLGTNTPIHLSFDVDALDPSVAPATGTPVRGGLTFREGHYICEAVGETGRLVGLDIVEVNPTLGDAVQSKLTIEIGCSLARAALGESLL